MSVATTILEQLGGGVFRMMTGASNFLSTPNSLRFKLPGRAGFVKSGITHVSIMLEPSDTYTVQFQRIRGTKAPVVVATHTDVFFDQLQQLFTRETGLDTHL